MLASGETGFWLRDGGPARQREAAVTVLQQQLGQASATSDGVAVSVPHGKGDSKIITVIGVAKALKGAALLGIAFTR